MQEIEQTISGTEPQEVVVPSEQQIQQEFKRMVSELRQKLKPKSRNELVRICISMLVENYMLKQERVNG